MTKHINDQIQKLVCSEREFMNTTTSLEILRKIIRNVIAVGNASPKQKTWLAKRIKEHNAHTTITYQNITFTKKQRWILSQRSTIFLEIIDKKLGLISNIQNVGPLINKREECFKSAFEPNNQDPKALQRHSKGTQTEPKALQRHSKGTQTADIPLIDKTDLPFNLTSNKITYNSSGEDEITTSSSPHGKEERKDLLSEGLQPPNSSEGVYGFRPPTPTKHFPEYYRPTTDEILKIMQEK